MSKKFELQDEFDNGDINHFTHYDYLLQLYENGQASEFRNHLTKLSNEAVVDFLKIKPKDLTSTQWVRNEILSRMVK